MGHTHIDISFLGYPTGYSQHNTPSPANNKWYNAKGVVFEWCPSTSPFPDSPRIFGLVPTTNETTPPGRSFPDHAKELTNAARRRAQNKTQSKRRRRAELTPSNQDLDKAQNTQSRRRKRADRSPEDKDQANAERCVKRRFLTTRDSRQAVTRSRIRRTTGR